jgi:hypothetical protein
MQCEESKLVAKEGSIEWPLCIKFLRIHTWKEWST